MSHCVVKSFSTTCNLRAMKFAAALLLACRGYAELQPSSKEQGQCVLSKSKQAFAGTGCDLHDTTCECKYQTMTKTPQVLRDCGFSETDIDEFAANAKKGYEGQYCERKCMHEQEVKANMNAGACANPESCECMATQLPKVTQNMRTCHIPEEDIERQLAPGKAMYQAKCGGIDVSALGKNNHEWITTLLFATASGTIGGLGVVAAVSWLLPSQSVQQQSQLLG